MENYSPACDRNKAVILQKIKPVIESEYTRRLSESVFDVLEVGSGTAQHAEYFCQHLPMMTWQCTDVAANLAGIACRRKNSFASGLSNFLPEIELDLSWPEPDTHLTDKQYDFAYTSNTLHIVSWPLCLKLVDVLDRQLKSNAKLFIYGPFKFAGKFTSSSNELFDAQLKASNPLSGIRDIEEVLSAFANVGFSLEMNEPMPANNQLLLLSR